MPMAIKTVWLALLWYNSVLLHSISGNMDLNITRGSPDVFTNPSLLNVRTNGSTTIFFNCDAFKAYCTTSDCLKCKCNADYPTFQGGSDGQCVSNEWLSVYLDKNNSFLAYQFAKTASRQCLVPFTDSSYLTVAPCDERNIKQHWIWTKYKQLLNLYTLKCVQSSGLAFWQLLPLRWYSKVSLTSCDASDLKQIWSCPSENPSLFYLSYRNAYLNYGNTNKYVILYSRTKSYSWWKRFRTTNENLCSAVSFYRGCYRYSDGSSMFTITSEDWKSCEDHAKQCEREKDFSTQVEARDEHCSNSYIQWKKTEFWNHSHWNYLPKTLLNENPFKLLKIDNIREGVTLKVNLTESRHLRGLIIKLYISCSTDQVTSQEHSEIKTHCVLIKFPGIFQSMSTAHTFPIRPSINPSIHSNLYSIQLPTTAGSSAENKSDDQKSDDIESRTGNISSTLVIIVVVCVVSFLLLAAIILFLVFKRRHRIKKLRETKKDSYEEVRLRPNEAETLNPYYATSAAQGGNRPEQADTLNPYYSPSDSKEGASDKSKQTETMNLYYSPSTFPNDFASNECKLYERSTNDYTEAVLTDNTSKPDSEHNYAKPDELMYPALSPNRVDEGGKAI